MQRRTLRTKFLLCSSLFSMASQVITTATLAASPLGTSDLNTTTLIKHVIVIYGENRSSGHLFAAYSPKPGETVNNLLSQGIVNADGTPGPKFSKAAQYQATDTTTFSIAPTKIGPFSVLPPLTAGGPKANSDTAPRSTQSPKQKLRNRSPIPIGPMTPGPFRDPVADRA